MASNVCIIIAKASRDRSLGKSKATSVKEKVVFTLAGASSGLPLEALEVPSLVITCTSPSLDISKLREKGLQISFETEELPIFPTSSTRGIIIIIDHYQRCKAIIIYAKSTFDDDELLSP
jgi:hypothetical protein